MEILLFAHYLYGQRRIPLAIPSKMQHMDLSLLIEGSELQLKYTSKMPCEVEEQVEDERIS